MGGRKESFSYYYRCAAIVLAICACSVIAGYVLAIGANKGGYLEEGRREFARRAERVTGGISGVVKEASGAEADSRVVAGRLDGATKRAGEVAERLSEVVEESTRVTDCYVDDSRYLRCRIISGDIMGFDKVE